ncbi:MAG: hypothetical protein KC561_11750, partial [Myxococcales bacterium]|nr:hypothetical protein [Myxococcales bacterium]
TIFGTAAQCEATQVNPRRDGNPNPDLDQPPYTYDGVWCGNVSLRNNRSYSMPHLTAVIVEMMPAEGSLGYRFPYGTGSDPSILTIDPAGEPTPMDYYGYWDYGTVLPGATATAQWLFAYSDTGFTFHGRLLAERPTCP